MKHAYDLAPVEAIPLADALVSDPAVAARLDRAAIERQINPAHYRGSSAAFIDRARLMRRTHSREGGKVNASPRLCCRHATAKVGTTDAESPLGEAIRQYQAGWRAGEFVVICRPGRSGALRFVTIACTWDHIGAEVYPKRRLPCVRLATQCWWRANPENRRAGPFRRDANFLCGLL